MGGITRAFSSYYAKKTCRECKPFIEKNSKVLDLGCGQAEVTSALMKYLNCRVVGVDIQDIRTNHDFPFYLIN